MPRIYFCKTDWGSVTYEELEKAFVEVKRGRSVRTVAKERKIGRSTLQRYMKKAEGKREKTVGYRGTAEAKRILSEELAEHIRMLRCREITFELVQKNNISVPSNWGEQRIPGRHNLYNHRTEAASLGSHGQVFSLIKKEIKEERDVPVPVQHASEEDSALICDSDRDLLVTDLLLT
uniref:Zgc:113274 n=1 Tax=Cyprinus carpio TaxID=7962 RepID=A0A8C1YPC4_CYPCA